MVTKAMHHLHITLLLLAAVAAAKATAVVDATSLSLSWSPPTDCRCVTRRAALLHASPCGVLTFKLTPGQTYPIYLPDLTGPKTTACGHQWIRVRVNYGPNVAHTAWAIDGEVDSCECPPSWRRLSPGAVGGSAVEFIRREDDNSKPRASPSTPSTKLLYCLCVIESQCNRSIGCHWDVTSDSCGPYQIKLNYWTDASDYAKRKLGGDWKTCTTGPSNMECSKETILYYMARYAKRCVGSTREPTDEDYARIHNGGPSGCKIPSTLAYWNRVHACMVKLS